MKKFKNIEDYYSYVDSIKKRYVPQDPYGEENWEYDQSFTFDLNNLNKDLKDFLDYSSDMVIRKTGAYYPKEFIINQFLIENKEIILKYNEIKKFLDDNFIKNKKGNWSPIRDFIFNAGGRRDFRFGNAEIQFKNNCPVHRVGKMYNLNNTLFDLSFIIGEIFEIHAKVELFVDEMNIFLLSPYDIAIYWFATTKIIKENVLNEKLGVSDVVFETAKLIYEKYNLMEYENNRNNIKRERMIVDTSDFPEPFNKMKIAIIFFYKQGIKKGIHGGVDRKDINAFELYIYQTCNNIARTLAHELNHIYQIYLRKKHYNTDKTMKSALRKSEQSPSIMSVYVQLLQRGIKDKNDFIEKLQDLPKYKKYVKILNDKDQPPKNKRIAQKMIRKMHKLWDLFSEENK